MNVLFLSLIDFDSITERNIYTDLLREFVKNGHKIYVISPVEKRTGRKTVLLNTEEAVILKPQIYNMQKTGYLEKAFSMVTIETILTKAIRKYFSEIVFDLIIYATPPISFIKPVKFVKKRDLAKTYLLQKDIFPEGLIDLEVLRTSGIRGFIYRYYRKKEINLLKISDYIGCMSNANIKYILTHNEFLSRERVELCPNSIEIVDKSVDKRTRIDIRNKYNIPNNATVFVYGGNLGKPQGIGFLIECLCKVNDIKNSYFLIIGDGTERRSIEEAIDATELSNVKLMRKLPKKDYDSMVGACDVGLIFLDHRFKIPNIPSRLLSYMQSKLPVLAVTDPETDLRLMIKEGKFGWWCESDNSDLFKHMILEITNNKNLNDIGSNGYEYLKKNFAVEDSYKTLIEHFE